MKKILLLFLAFAFVPFNLLSQSCLPDGIVFYSQSDIDDFETNYPACTEIEGNVSIGNGYPNDISSLDGLDVLEAIGGYLFITTNDNLNSLDGLENLETIGGYLHIFECPGLTDLDGLDGLTSIGGGLILYENHSLVDLRGLDDLNTVGGVVEIGYHEALSSLEGLESLTSIGGMDMGYVNNLPDFSGMDNLNTVTGNFVINDCDQISTLSGLNSLTTVNGDFNLFFLESLVSLSGLESLTTVDGQLRILSNPVADMAPLSNLTSVGSTLEIKGSAAVDLTGLENLTSIGGELVIGNNQFLESLTGIQHIAYQSISNLKITYNPLLTTCEVKSVCDYLVDPGGIIWLHNNATGCSSEDEVVDACDATALSENQSGGQLILYPNPAQDLIFIESKTGRLTGTVAVADLLGRLVIEPVGLNGTLDISSLQNGIYYLVVRTGEDTFREKLVIE